MANDSDLFLFGDDLDAVLEALEIEESVDKLFEESVVEVQRNEIACGICQKKCKSKSGLKRHMTCKHGGAGENVNAINEKEEQGLLNPGVLASMVNEVKKQLKDNKRFPKNIREELQAYIYTTFGEESVEFAELQKIYRHNKNPEKFYTMFYSTVALNSTRYFHGLTKNAATLLSTKLADHMLAYSKEKALTTTVPDFNFNLNDKEVAALQYLGGYVVHKLYNKHAHSKTCQSSESQHAMSLLKVGKEEDNTSKESQKLTSSLNRGGLWGITKPLQEIFLQTEKHFRLSTSNQLTRIDIDKIRSKATANKEVISAFDIMLANAELRVNKEVAKDVLHSIVDLYIRVRSFSLAKDIVQKHKIQSKHLKEKALRKEISRASKESEDSRQP